jgi:hypothetical protein
MAGITERQDAEGFSREVVEVISGGVHGPAG